MAEEAWKPGNETLKEQKAKEKAECIQAASNIYKALLAELQQSTDLRRLDKYSAAYLYHRIDIPLVSGAPANFVLQGIQQVLTRAQFLRDEHSLRAQLERTPRAQGSPKAARQDFWGITGAWCRKRSHCASV